MQCSSCGASYPESENCPECPAVPPNAFQLNAGEFDKKEQNEAKPKRDKPRRSAQKSARTSTLIEFPGGGRVPQWRKELSERVREVQKRRALEATLEPAATAGQRKQASRSPEPTQLGLVPPSPAVSINPLVMKALLRIERAHRTPYASTGYSRGGPALARLPEEAPEVDVMPANFQTEVVTSEAHALAPIVLPERSQKDHGLVVVLPQLEQKAATEPVKPRKIRSIGELAENAALSYLENLPSAHAVFVDLPRDDRASFVSRTVAALIDLIVVAFASCPFAAAIELSGGNWNDLRVKGLMAGIVVAVTFIYQTVSTALTGRTLGMKLFGIRAVDVRTSLMPSGSQSARRALGYIFSLATAGLGILYGVFDAERRTAHDHFSGTIVVHD
ncbi:MAG: RDD family protein [Pyrinomonadaceae bacterium]